MSNVTNKLSERSVASLPATWVSLANYRQYTAFGTTTADAVTITLLQATDASGTGSKTLVAAVAPTLVGSSSAMASDLDAANDFAFVSATVTGTGAVGVGVRTDGRFSE